MKQAGKQGTLVPFVIGVTLMGALLGWIVYADELSQDVATNFPTSASGTPLVNPPIDSANISLISQTRDQAETNINAQITNTLYGTPPTSIGMVDTHFTGALLDQGFCGGPETGNCPTDPLLQYGDEKGSVLWAGTFYDQSRKSAASVFLNNLLNPAGVPGITNFQAQMSSNNMSPADVTGSPQTQAAFVQAMSDVTALSIIAAPFAEMMAKRTQVTASGNNPPPAVSQMQVMEQQGMARAMSSTWAASLATLTPQQVQIQQAIMQANQLWLEYERYRQTERVEALLALLALQNLRTSKAVAATVSASAASSNSSSSSSSGSGN